MIRKLLVVASAIVIPMSVVAVSGGIASANTTGPAAKDSIICKAITGTLHFNRPLNNTGYSSGTIVTTVSATLSSCTVSGTYHVAVSKGVVTGTITSAGRNEFPQNREMREPGGERQRDGSADHQMDIHPHRLVIGDPRQERPRGYPLGPRDLHHPRVGEQLSLTHRLLRGHASDRFAGQVGGSDDTDQRGDPHRLQVRRELVGHHDRLGGQHDQSEQLIRGAGPVPSGRPTDEDGAPGPVLVAVHPVWPHHALDPLKCPPRIGEGVGSKGESVLACHLD